MAEEQSQSNRLADRTANIAGIVTLAATFIILTIGFPALGAWYLGGLALHAGGGMIGAGIAGVAGMAAGLGPFKLVDYFGKKKDPSYGTLEAMCLPAAIVGETVNCVLSPQYGMKRLRAAFSRSAKKATAPEPQPAAQAPTPAAPKTP